MPSLASGTEEAEGTSGGWITGAPGALHGIACIASPRLKSVTGDPMDDSIACAVNGQNIFTLPAKFAPDGSPVSTDMMDISAYAGQSVELFFGLVGGTSTNCQVAIDGIRFITIPQPKVGVVASGANVEVKWPAAAVGWVLETSDTLAPNSWQPVPMTGVAVASGVATIEQPRTSTRRFYRLRRNP